MLDIKTMTKICTDWGIHDPNMFASITLQRPFSPNKAVHVQNIDVKDMYELQNEMKERIKQLIFVSRNMNIVRANNKAVGSPVNRINIMARWAVRGISDKGTWLSWRSFVFESTLFLMSLSFWFLRIKDLMSQYFLHTKTRGLEDVLDETMKEEVNIKTKRKKKRGF
jgi:aarF domain-containing kinase